MRFVGVTTELSVQRRRSNSGKRVFRVFPLEDVDEDFATVFVNMFNDMNGKLPLWVWVMFAIGIAVVVLALMAWMKALSEARDMNFIHVRYPTTIDQTV